MDKVDIHHVRDRMLAYRADRGWTQVDLAREAGLSPTTIAHIETLDNKRPRRITLTRIAVAFGVSLDVFLEDGPPVPAGGSGLELVYLMKLPVAERQKLLEAATDEERERLLDDVGRYLTGVERGALEAAQEAAQEDNESLRQTKWQQHEMLVRHAYELGRLHQQAESVARRPTVAGAPA